MQTDDQRAREWADKAAEVWDGGAQSAATLALTYELRALRYTLVGAPGPDQRGLRSIYTMLNSILEVLTPRVKR